MTENLCRLCFNEKPRAIGIFTVRGSKANIANIIRMHLADEVRYSSIASKHGS